MNDIRIAIDTDIDAIAALEAKCLREAWSKEALGLFVKEGAFAVVAEADGKIVSYCTVLISLDEMQIINVATDPELRGRGYALAVMEKVIEESVSRGAISISLEVRESNEAAIALYKKLGFEICGLRKGFYKNPSESALVMIKKL